MVLKTIYQAKKSADKKRKGGFLKWILENSKV